MLTEHCKSECPYFNEMITRARERNLDNLVMHIKLMTHTRSRRGSLNFVGSISRSLFGTLDDDDLELINKNIDKLFYENNKLKTNITYKTNLKTTALPLNDSLEEILTKIENAPKIINNVQSYRMHLNQISNEVNSLNYEHRIRSLKKWKLSAL